MFHVKDGLYFERLPNGNVRIVQMKTALADEREIAFETTIDKDAWSSVICSVSAGGESGYRFYLGQVFHNSPQEAFMEDVRKWAINFQIK